MGESCPHRDSGACLQCLQEAHAEDELTEDSDDDMVFTMDEDNE